MKLLELWWQQAEDGANSRGDGYGQGAGGAGGGLKGCSGTTSGQTSAGYSYGYGHGNGGTQTSKGTLSEYKNGTFLGEYESTTNITGGIVIQSGGGGGYYQGGYGIHGGGGGGSSYISGHNGCTLSSTGYQFNNTEVIDGEGYSWGAEKGEQTLMPTTDGSSTMAGNSGNGYAKITWVGV